VLRDTSHKAARCVDHGRGAAYRWEEFIKLSQDAERAEASARGAAGTSTTMQAMREGQWRQRVVAACNTWCNAACTSANAAMHRSHLYITRLSPLLCKLAAALTFYAAASVYLYYLYLYLYYLYLYLYLYLSIYLSI